MKTLDIVLDGPPGPETGRFVEVEVDGRSVRVGEWVPRGSEWVLRISAADVARALGPSTPEPGRGRAA